MGLKNELLDKKERLNAAWYSEDLDSIEEIVQGWLDEGWTYQEVFVKCQDWLNVDEYNFNEVMEMCGIVDMK